MSHKFKKGQLVRLTQYDKFGESDLFGYVMDYVGKSVGLSHYIITDYTRGSQVYLRKANCIKPVTKEEEFLLFLER
jgi:hypothetical protein